MDIAYQINRLPENCASFPLNGPFDPAALPEPWASLNEAKVDIFPWHDAYQPACRARLGWNEKGLHVLMYADEPVIRTEITQIGGDVFTDSCVECFMGFNAATLNYVNCEVNPNAVMHIGVGEGRYGRTVFKEIPEGFNPSHSTHEGGWWAVSYTIPAAFIKERFGVTLASGMTVRGNLYKCGAPQHHGMLREYNTVKPDFHRPELFPDMLLG